jgi:hypothetical protein
VVRKGVGEDIRRRPNASRLKGIFGVRELIGMYLVKSRNGEPECSGDDFLGRLRQYAGWPVPRDLPGYTVN